MEDFSFLAWLGHGSYGSVQLCRVSPSAAAKLLRLQGDDLAEPSEQRSMTMAMKTWRDAHTDSKVMRVALREIRVLQGLAHPNIVKQHHAFRSPSGRVCQVFEYGGQSALQLLEQRFKFGIPQAQLKRLALQLVSALEYLHDTKKILHRDIKPANVLVDAAGVLRLCDFGFARHAANSADPKGAERLTQYVVTRWYRAPEVLLAMKYGTAADIWSLGCTLAEMATAEPLLPGASSLDQLGRIAGTIGPLPPHMAACLAPQLRASTPTAPPPAPAAAAAGTGEAGAGGALLRRRLSGRACAALIDVVEACLRIDPRDRPSARQLLAMPYFAAPPQQQPHPHHHQQQQPQQQRGPHLLAASDVAAAEAGQACAGEAAAVPGVAPRAVAQHHRYAFALEGQPQQQQQGRGQVVQQQHVQYGYFPAAQLCRSSGGSSSLAFTNVSLAAGNGGGDSSSTRFGSMPGSSRGRGGSAGSGSTCGEASGGAAPASAFAAAAQGETPTSPANTAPPPQQPQEAGGAASPWRASSATAAVQPPPRAQPGAPAPPPVAVAATPAEAYAAAAAAAGWPVLPLLRTLAVGASTADGPADADGSTTATASACCTGGGGGGAGTPWSRGWSGLETSSSSVLFSGWMAASQAAITSSAVAEDVASASAAAGSSPPSAAGGGSRPPSSWLGGYLGEATPATATATAAATSTARSGWPLPADALPGRAAPAAVWEDGAAAPVAGRTGRPAAAVEPPPPGETGAQQQQHQEPGAADATASRSAWSAAAGSEVDLGAPSTADLFQGGPEGGAAEERLQRGGRGQLPAPAAEGRADRLGGSGSAGGAGGSGGRRGASLGLERGAAVGGLSPDARNSSWRQHTGSSFAAVVATTTLAVAAAEEAARAAAPAAAAPAAAAGGRAGQGLPSGAAGGRAAAAPHRQQRRSAEFAAAAAAAVGGWRRAASLEHNTAGPCFAVAAPEALTADAPGGARRGGGAGSSRRGGGWVERGRRWLHRLWLQAEQQAVAAPLPSRRG